MSNHFFYTIQWNGKRWQNPWAKKFPKQQPSHILEQDFKISMKNIHVPCSEINLLRDVLVKNVLKNILLRIVLLRTVLLRNVLLRNIYLRISSSEISSSDMPIKTFQFLEEDFQLLEIMLYFFVMAIPKVVKYIPNTGSSLPRSPCFHTKTGSSFRLLGIGSQTLDSMLALLLSTHILRL